MSFCLLPGRSVGDEVRRIAREQIDRAAAEIDDERLDRHHAIHQVRKRFKKVRALLRLVRPALEDGDVYRRENAWFRDAGRALSRLRDAEALLESWDRMVVECDLPPDLPSHVRDRLVARRERIAGDDHDLGRELAGLRDALAGARFRTDAWRVAGEGFDVVVEGLRKTYRRGRKRMREAHADPTAERFHEWRKRSKDHRYHHEILRETCGPVASERWPDVKRLSDLLGDDHDLVVLEATIRNEMPDLAGDADLVALLGERRRALRSAAHDLGHRIYAEGPKRLVRRFRDAWQGPPAFAGDDGDPSGRRRSGRRS